LYEIESQLIGFLNVRSSAVDSKCALFCKALFTADFLIYCHFEPCFTREQSNWNVKIRQLKSGARSFVPCARQLQIYSKEKKPIVNQTKIPAAFDVRGGKIIVASLAPFSLSSLQSIALRFLLKRRARVRGRGEV
jgi:hypothetical protein